MSDVKFDWKEFDELGKDLRICAERAVPYAARNALNNAAFEGRKLWQANMGRKFTIRNTYVQRSIRVVKATGLDIDRMEATLGTPLDFMATEELGGTERPKKGSHLPIPVRAASGKTVRRGFRHDRANPWDGSGRIRSAFGSQRQRNAIAIAKAAKANGQSNRVAVVETVRGKMMVQVLGRKRVKTRILWTYFRPSAHVPAHATLQPTLSEIDKLMPQAMVDSIIDQLKRNRIFGF